MDQTLVTLALLPEFTLVYSGFNGNGATACVRASVRLSVQDLSPYMHDCRYFIHIYCTVTIFGTKIQMNG